MVFENEFVPDHQQAIKSILDYQITIKDLKPEETHYLALGMNYSVAGFEMILQRKMSFYIVTYYLPSGLFVVVSWISFLVNPEVIPGRMTLLVTIFLVLINIFNTIQTNSPKAEGLTGMYLMSFYGINLDWRLKILYIMIHVWHRCFWPRALYFNEFLCVFKKSRFFFLVSCNDRTGFKSQFYYHWQHLSGFIKTDLISSATRHKQV